MNSFVMIDRWRRIIECHNGVHGSMKQALDYALEAGQLLTEVKEELQHGEFLPWLKENMPFEQPTAWRYMKLYEYQNKLFSVNNLQEAYRQIETIEAQEKKRKERENREKIQQFEETGEKPETWDRSTDYQYKKTKEDREFEEQKQAAFQEKEEAAKKHYSKEEIDKAIKNAERVSAELEKHAHLNLSSYADTASQSSMFAAIELYLNSFDGVSSQLEAAHNLIKKLKMIVNELQMKSVEIKT
jgi:hypothetical protein